MENRKKAALIARLAGVCAALLAIDRVVWNTLAEARYSNIFFQINYIGLVLVWCFLAVALFLQNKTLIFSAAVAKVVLNLYGYILCPLIFWDNISTFNLLITLFNVLFAVIFFSVLINSPKLATLWFLPAALSAIYCVQYIYFFDFSAGWQPAWLWPIFYVLHLTLYALVGYWIHIFPFTPRSAVISAPKQKVDTVGLLRKYSALLDSGAITEEEFQEIKSKLLT